MAKRLDGSHLAKCYVDDYDRLLKEKVQGFKEKLQANYGGELPEIEVFESTKEHFRMRANFQMWHDNPNNKTPEGFYYCMFDDNKYGKKEPHEVKTFPRATERINQLMQEIMQACHEHPVIFQNLFEVRFLSTLSNQALVVLLYKKPLAADWKAVATELGKKLDVKIIGRARKELQLANAETDTITETLHVNQQPFHYLQTEGAFSQPNGHVCEHMLTWAVRVTRSSLDKADLLELYCGGGTFTAPLSQNFSKVLATEISKASVALAKKNFVMNNISNVSLLALSSEEFTQWYESSQKGGGSGGGKVAGVRLDMYNIQTVFVDPPRSGLDLLTCKLVSKFDTIVYISCNPDTLVRDIKILSETHAIQHLASFDQFPYTHHLECGAVLVRKAAAVVAAAEETKEELGEGEGTQEEERESKRQRTDV